MQRRCDMSAFFDWDVMPVIDAVLDGLWRQGRSVNPDDYEPGADEWADTVKINLPHMADMEYFTDEWDVNIWDNDGVFTVTAYPVYDGLTDCSSWITLLAIPVEAWENV
jgi:hypothetical protein